MKWILISSVLFSCAFAKEQINISPITVSPGHVKYFEMNLPQYKVVGKSYLNCGGKRTPITQDSKGMIRGYWAQSYFSKLGNKDCTLVINKKSVVTKKDFLQITNFDYPKESLNVDKKRVSVNKKDLKRVQRERAILKKVYNNSYPEFYFYEKFVSPLDFTKEYHKLTSHYGKRRIFNKTHKTQHLGTDFRAKIGSIIPAANKGKVVLAQDLFYSGKTVILDHGMGIFTMYGHLSKISVGVGQFVTQKQKLGLSGMTGRVTGPHLHWGVKVHGNWVDGLVLVNESQKHFL